MLDPTVKKLLGLLQGNNASDVRCAAAKVFGQIGPRDGEVGRALRDTLHDPDASVRLEVLATIGQLRIEQALPQLLTRISEGGPEAEAAAQAAARLGARGTRALQDLMSQVAPGLRRRIAAALGVGGTASAGTAAVDALLDTDPGVVDAATRSLISEVASFPESQRRALADHVLAMLKPNKRAPLSPVSETALVRLLAALGDARGEAAFWFRIDEPSPAEVRAAALHALGMLPLHAGRDKVQRLLKCAADANFRVAAPALMMLKGMPVSQRSAKDWLLLFEAADPAVRRFAIDKLGDLDTADVCRALLQQLHHADGQLRDVALARLGHTDRGREALVAALLEAPSPDEAWELARGQSRFAGQYEPGVRTKLFNQACRYLESGDRRADALLFLLREIDPKRLRDRLEERGMALRKKKDYQKALVYLRLLARDPACAEAVRFEMAACALKLSEHDLATDSRSADAALQPFARLIHSHDVDPAVRIKQAKWLGPEDLFYLGFHFVEGDRQEQEFGAKILRLMMQRSPRSKLAKDAKSKLRRTNL
jgi:HEAT repeat protein